MVTKLNYETLRAHNKKGTPQCVRMRNQELPGVVRSARLCATSQHRNITKIERQTSLRHSHPVENGNVDDHREPTQRGRLNSTSSEPRCKQVFQHEVARKVFLRPRGLQFVGSRLTFATLRASRRAATAPTVPTLAQTEEDQQQKHCTQMSCGFITQMSTSSKQILTYHALRTPLPRRIFAGNPHSLKLQDHYRTSCTTGPLDHQRTPEDTSELDSKASEPRRQEPAKKPTTPPDQDKLPNKVGETTDKAHPKTVYHDSMSSFQ